MFNAAYEAGLPITARTNHALYISHYPQGRDATVNYPDTDLKFVNDTGHWLLLRTFVSSSSLTVNLYGTPQHRRVESDDGAARHDRARADGGHEGPDAPRRARRSSTRPGSPPLVDERHAQASTTRTASCSTTTRGTRATSARRRTSGSAPKPKPKPKPKPVPTTTRACYLPTGLAPTDTTATATTATGTTTAPTG